MRQTAENWVSLSKSFPEFISVTGPAEFAQMSMQTPPLYKYS